MPSPNHDLSFHVLLACANKAADGFYPRVDGGSIDIDRNQLDAALDRLRLGGFIEIADWDAAKGQGYRVTDAGRAAAVRPELLNRPAAAATEPAFAHPRRSASPWDEAEDIRRSVLTPPRPIVTPILIGINILVYVAVCFYNLTQGRSIANIINGYDLLMPGAIFPLRFWLLHEYWQLFTYMFLHGTPVHILVNMFCLFTLGTVLEGRWGWKRYLILYFGSGLIGGVAVLFAGGDPRITTVGASGAISGLLTSLAVWAWMHRHHLPPQFVEGHFRVVGLNLLILIGTGAVMANISTSCHVGGAIAGAVLSIPLAWLSPYLTPRHHIMAIVSLFLIAAISFVALDMAPRPEIFVNPVFKQRVGR